MKETAEDWCRALELRFWSQAAPWQVKFETEKRTGILLARASEASPRLVYTGTGGAVPMYSRLTLAFEEALPERNLYGFRLDFRVPAVFFTAAGGMTPAKALAESNRIFAYWTHMLTIAESAPASGAEQWTAKPYAEHVQQALDEEETARNVVPDNAAIAAVQHEILQVLRRGSEFRTSHHEGGSVICFDGKQFVDRGFGLEEYEKRFPNDAEFLSWLRRNFDWDSRQDTYPHSPPDLDAWKFIRSRIQP